MVYSLLFRRYAPFKQFGGGFEGDDRTEASADPLASARTVGAIAFGPDFVGPVSGSSSGSTFPGLGPRIERLIGRHFSDVQASVTVESKSVSQLGFTARTAGANPLVPGAPRIVTIIKVAVSFSDTSISISGKMLGDDFPNAEVVIYDSAAKGIIIFDFKTSGGQTTGPFTRLPSLPGGHDEREVGQFSKRIPIGSDGAFLGI